MRYYKKKVISLPNSQVVHGQGKKAMKFKGIVAIAAKK